MRRRREAALVVQEQNRPWRYRERRAAPPEQPVGGGGGGSTFPPFLFSAHTGAVFSVPRRFWLRRGPFSVSIPFWRCMQPETPPFLDSFYHSCVPCPVLHLIYFSSRRWLWRSKSNVRSPRVSLSRPPVFRLPPNEEEFPFQNLYTHSHEERSLLLPACLPSWLTSKPVREPCRASPSTRVERVVHRRHPKVTRPPHYRPICQQVRC